MNRFDERAATWDDDPAHLERAQVVAGAIRDAAPLDSSVRLLEYGAGTGLVSQVPSDAVGPITVADTSAGMREVMENKVAAGVIADARVWDLDLASAPLPVSEDRFDLIVTVIAPAPPPSAGAGVVKFRQAARPGRSSGDRRP